MSERLRSLERSLSTARGNSSQIDLAIGKLAGSATSQSTNEAYSSSVDACLNFIAGALPQWHWHVGYGARGIMPYAALDLYEGTADKEPVCRIEAEAPTVPLALLLAAVRALIWEAERGSALNSPS